MSEAVLYEKRGPVAWVTLNRPEVLNAINDEVLHGLLDAIHQAGRDEAVRVLVLTGAGRAFSAGGDIKAMQAMTEESFPKTIHLYMRVSHAMRALDKPALAAVNGYAMGGGFELALICDLRIAGEAAKFGLPDVALGLSPTSGMTYLLTRLLGTGRAMHLALTNETIDAREAERLGVVTRVVPDVALLDEADKLAREIATRPPVGLAFTKRLFYAAQEGRFMDSLEQEEAAELACFQSPETRAAFKEFLERKKK